MCLLLFSGSAWCEGHCLPGCRAQVEYGTSANGLDSSASGSAKKYVQDYPGDVYVSGVMHHAKLEGLQPLTTYFYRCARTWPLHRPLSSLQALNSRVWALR